MKPPRTTFVYLILRGLLKLNATKVLLTSVFLWLTAYEFCRLRYWRDPHSAFFDSRNAYEWKYSLYREHEARRLIAGHNAPSDPYIYVKARMDPTICVSFATVKWDGYDYFEASVGSLLEGLDPRERSALGLNILSGTRIRAGTQAGDRNGQIGWSIRRAHTMSRKRNSAICRSWRRLGISTRRESCKCFGC